MEKINDPEVKKLATFSEHLKEEYANQDKGNWVGSPFEWILNCPSRQKGTIGEKLVSEYLSRLGFIVERSSDSEADRVVLGHRIEIKMSTLWKTNLFKFQQLRDQNYDLAICLGLCPYDAYCWVLPKSEIMERWANGDISSQHGGSKGADTAWLQVDPTNPPDWLKQWGGRLESASRLMRKMLE